MTQTGKISGALLIGFLVYVTLLGHLPAYFALLWKKSSTGGGFQFKEPDPGGNTPINKDNTVQVPWWFPLPSGPGGRAPLQLPALPQLPSLDGLGG